MPSTSVLLFRVTSPTRYRVPERFRGGFAPSAPPATAGELSRAGSRAAPSLPAQARGARSGRTVRKRGRPGQKHGSDAKWTYYRKCRFVVFIVVYDRYASDRSSHRYGQIHPTIGRTDR